MDNNISDHHDGHGLNEQLRVERVKPDSVYEYVVHTDVSGTDRAFESGCTGQARENLATITFQSQNPVLGVNGTTDEAVAAVLLDRAREWEKGPLHTEENARVIVLLEEVLACKKLRADKRAKRGVLGSQDK